MKLDFRQISMFEYCPSLLPDADDSNITERQLRKIYRSLFTMRQFRKRIESRDVEGIVEHIAFPIEHGCISYGHGWDEITNTTFTVDKRGVKFDDNGEYHGLRKIALLLIEKFA